MSVTSEELLVGIETGGTKIVCAAVSADDVETVIAKRSIPTRTPSTALADVADFLAGLQRGIAGVGIGAFGPLDLDRQSPTYGSITSTPKRGWDNFDLLGTIQLLVHPAPCLITTDVASAALGEAHRGAHPGLQDLAYATVGTGVGVGLLKAGQLMVGSGWPEVAHVPVERHPDDVFAGVCRFHGTCLEGMASGPAISARHLEIRKSGALRDREADVAITAFYLAQLVATLYYCLGSEQIVLGGGVMKTPGLLEAVYRELPTRVGPVGSRGSSRTLQVSGTALDGEAGLVGALILAEQAAVQADAAEGRHLRLL